MKSKKNKKRKKLLFLELFKHEKSYIPLKEIDTPQGRKISESIRNLKK